MRTYRFDPRKVGNADRLVREAATRQGLIVCATDAHTAFIRRRAERLGLTVKVVTSDEKRCTIYPRTPYRTCKFMPYNPADRGRCDAVEGLTCSHQWRAVCVDQATQ